ncbi:MAG: 2-oxoacid:ferredoxin oxidoreductase subunit alpha [Chloroflexi bacterium RBG_16_51_9]|nr:MAG: 2-oxoacid:ferredoxin oxidoreductase subunit alpha [Chloroflexi bacterium RBG_16_51_9]
MVGGEAGQGVQSIGFILAKSLARGGYHIFADQDYESRIRGGHNFYRVRAADSPISAIADAIDILVALNIETISLHQKELDPKGVIIFDIEKVKDAAGLKNAFGVPLDRLATESAGDKLMANTVALGAALGLVRYDLEIIGQVLVEFFKNAEVAEKNIKATRAGYEYVRDNFKGSFDSRLSPISKTKRMLLNGNEAMALGAIAAGCKFMAAYPMTPVTSIMEYLAAKADEFGLVVVPAEDEIAAINMTIGAGYAGARAMTATSGSGFCLMVEGLGLAAITETPIVVVEGQRPGPAIGLPTRTEQGDLQFVLYAHQGDFPRAVLAPNTIEDCFWLTVKAFNLADKYQTPVIVMTDHVLATSYTTVDKFDLSKVTIDRGLLLSASEPNDAEYKRYKITPSGISPRAFPGQGKALVVADSDEHDEAGHLIEDAETRTQMMDKRMRKLTGLSKEVATPEVYGPKQADTLLIGWGSTCGAIREATDILNKHGASVSCLSLNELWPFPAEAVSNILNNAKRSFVIENNATGQLARLIRTETGIKVSGNILKYDGRPFTPDSIAQAVRKEAR